MQRERGKAFIKTDLPIEENSVIGKCKFPPACETSSGFHFQVPIGFPVVSWLLDSVCFRVSEKKSAENETSFEGLPRKGLQRHTAGLSRVQDALHR